MTALAHLLQGAPCSGRPTARLLCPSGMVLYQTGPFPFTPCTDTMSQVTFTYHLAGGSPDLSYLKLQHQSSPGVLEPCSQQKLNDHFAPSTEQGFSLSPFAATQRPRRWDSLGFVLALPPQHTAAWHRGLTPAE